jgi:hypothetical protein
VSQRCGRDSARRGSRETIGRVIQRLNGLIDRLDTFVSNTYHDAPDKLAAWEAARASTRRDGGRPHFLYNRFHP